MTYASVCSICALLCCVGLTPACNDEKSSGGTSSGGNTSNDPGSGGKSSEASAASGGKSSSDVSSGGTSSTRVGTQATGAGGSTDSSDPTTVCGDPTLVWKSANKTNYISYPDPGSEECVVYNGCQWEGQFAACDGKKTEQWVDSHNIAAAFPDFQMLKLHDLCLRKGSKVIIVTVLDTCGDSDCDGCCTQNQGSADQLIDLESYTNKRWGVADGPIEWADLGPTKTQGCD